jgi:hypothetical protein
MHTPNSSTGFTADRARSGHRPPANLRLLLAPGRPSNSFVPIAINDGGAQRCVYQDPIAHRQLEVYRQRYR